MKTPWGGRGLTSVGFLQKSYHGVRQGRQGGKVDKGEKEKKTIKTHEDLVIYQKAFETTMIICELSKQFPPEERYSLTD